MTCAGREAFNGPAARRPQGAPGVRGWQTPEVDLTNRYRLIDMRARSHIATVLAGALAVTAGFMLAPTRALAASSPIVTPTIRPPFVDYQPPTRPGPLRIDYTGGVTLAWGAATDDSGYVVYEVYAGGRLIARTTSTRYLYSTGPIVRPQPYYFAVRAVDGAGNSSPKVFAPQPVYEEPRVVPPPLDVTLQDWVRGYVSLEWKEPAATTVTSLPIAGYEVSVMTIARSDAGTPIVRPQPLPVAEVGGAFLRMPAPPPGRYVYLVRTIDAAGNYSVPARLAVVRE